ncbi:MAG TPA: UDP-N-acetylmuramoyl-L-alanyl-D-glutamate--2,6-diaminopimelate ligase, partial [Bacteroidales bacterium]|nr:UDP-N-acetylmuramoyl-L-alanyl-D-glutamate--2,6-diaminopimelate ligase [Bacteroidales bacterium]
LNNLLQQMVTEGCTHCFIEVSSHAICQNRIAGLTFTGGVFTNITHDHLDYHKTFNDYLKAKKQFFDNLPATAFALSNIDDKNGKIILQNTKAYCYYYGINKIAEFKCRILENSFLGLLLNIDNIEVWTRLIGKFNAYNLLATYATAILLNENKDRILTIISNIKGAAGRFECVKNDSIIGIVDYAHTPDALENVLDTIDEINNKQNNIITVIGAGGNRDKTKRPLMAKIASEKSNKLILTSDNPRFEEPLSIIEDMQKGIDINNRNKTIVIVDRKEAIKTACNMANTGDIILIAGKGHENYQEINGVKTHFNDMELLKEFLNIK